MAPTIHGRPYTEGDHGPVLQPCAPHSVLSRLGGKWSLPVLSLMALAPGQQLRFSCLKRGVSGITQRMLTVTLRDLERDGLVTRHVFAEVPPRVEYRLTTMGRSVLPALEGFTAWIGHHWPEIEAARQRFDRQAEACGPRPTAGAFGPA